jgi:hypothetical protein
MDDFLSFSKSIPEVGQYQSMYASQQGGLHDLSSTMHFSDELKQVKGVHEQVHGAYQRKDDNDPDHNFYPLLFVIHFLFHFFLFLILVSLRGALLATKQSPGLMVRLLRCRSQ